jgi:hypothetical protein
MDVKKLNGVFYTALSDPTLVKYKTTKRHHALYDTYTARPYCNKDIEFKLVLGSEYVDAGNSYLRFQFTYDTSIAPPIVNDAASLSTGFTDLLQAILIVDRYGNTLERIENLYQIASVLATSHHDGHYLYETLQCFPSTKALDHTAEYDVIIPLHFLCGLFRSTTLLPPHLLDGCRIRLALRGANHVLSPTTPAVPALASDEGWTYTISRPTIVTETYVFDQRLHSLVTSEYESETGLHVPFVSVTNITQGVDANAFTTTMHVAQSFSRATKVFLSTESVYESAHDYINAYVTNMFPTPGSQWVYKSIQAKIGDTAYPNTAIDSPDVAWHLWTTAFNKHRTGSAVAGEAKDSFENGNRVVIDTNRGVLGADSGVTISNKFPAVVNMTLRDASAPTALDPAFEGLLNTLGVSHKRLLHMFIEHQRIIVARPEQTRILI